MIQHLAFGSLWRGELQDVWLWTILQKIKYIAWLHVSWNKTVHSDDPSFHIACPIPIWEGCLWCDSADMSFLSSVYISAVFLQLACFFLAMFKLLIILTSASNNRTSSPFWSLSKVGIKQHSDSSTIFKENGICSNLMKNSVTKDGTSLSDTKNVQQGKPGLTDRGCGRCMNIFLKLMVLSCCVFFTSVVHYW